MLRRRPDATLAEDVPSYRRIMPFLMRGRNESVVYFDQHIRVERAERFLERFNEAHPRTPASIFHLVLRGIARALHQRPRLNRFVAGGRLWQRDGIWISFSAKKRMGDDDAPLVVLKRRFDPSESFERMTTDIHARLHEGRSHRKSRTDKELGAVLRLPPAGLRGVLALERAADALGLLPRSYIDGDPMFASAFVANLGSLKMDAGYHHLYEYGNIPAFCVIGQVAETPVVEAGRVVAGRTVSLRYSYDERVEDGLYAQRGLELVRRMVEDPEGHGAGSGPASG
ncbi:MAG: 2-oxo acid dehydrogenase subunit E2 [Polyangiales bacterium]